ncbi:hypothetical protein ACWCPT_18780 [Streptomyces sp. NPDC002308]
MIFRKARFAAAVADFESAVGAQDGKRSGAAFVRLQKAVGPAADAELHDGGPRLAALLPDVPPGPRSVAAMVVGACVERGADAGRCAPGVLAGLRTALTSAAEFARLWSATGGGDFPEPGTGEPDDASLARTGFEPAIGWWTLPEWEMAAVALLADPAVRASAGYAGERDTLLRLTGEVAEASGDSFTCLVHMLQVLDDEPLVVLDRATGSGYALRMTGLGDNFQLHTLLADALIGGGHLTGHAPGPEEAAVCRDAPGQVHTTGSFNLVAPDGTWIWNEGTPSDIPLVDGVRLLVLDPPPYARSWPAGRFFPRMRGDLVLERVLGPDETARWFTRVSPAAGAPAGR